MSNEIDLVVGKDVSTQLDTLMKELVKIDEQIKKIGETAATMNTKLGVTNTADLTKLTAENEKLNKKIQELTGSSTVLETKLANLSAAQARATKAATDASIAEEKLITATNKNTVATEKRTKATLEETIAQREATNQSTLKIKAGQEEAKTYAQLDAQHKLAVKTAQDLAVQTGRSGKAYEEAKNKANEYGKQLRVIDTDIGKHTRNVGNYSSSWNGLGNSINQLTREAPAFANSVQTGFMALSNNIPILTDELGVLIQKNKDLQAEGKSTQSILKTVAGAFFSWQTAISLGVTLLTVYGAQLWEAAFGLSATEKGIKAFKDNLNTLNNTTSEYTVKLKTLSEIVLDSTESDKDRKIALNELKEIIPEVGKADIDRADSLKTVIHWTNKYIEAGIDRAKVDALTKNIAEEQTKLDILKTSSPEERINWYQKIYLGIAKMTGTHKTAMQVVKNSISQEEVDIQSDLASLEILLQEYTIKANKANKELLGLQDKPKTEKDSKKDKSAEEAAKKEEERLKREYEALKSNLERQKELDKDALESFKGSIDDKTKLSIQLAQDEINIANIVFQEKKRLAKGDVDLITVATNEKLTAEENAQQENLKRVTKYYDEQEKAAAEYAKKLSKFNFLDTEQYKKYLADKKKADEDRKRYLEKTLDELKNYAESFSSEFASNLGFKETFDFFIKTDKEGKTMWQKLDIDGVSAQEKFKARFNAIAESSQEMFNKMAEYSMAHYEQDYARLEAQKEASLKFAGESTVAKEKIEEQYAEKKKEIDKKKFEADKKISMVNIAIDTAQAIMTTLGETGFFGTPLAIIMGAFGAAQLAMVAAQQFPAYAEGTDNHSGGLMLVNDGKGSNYQEKVILPSGKVIRPQGRNVLMDAPKGTKVLNHEQQLFEMLQSNNISMSSQGNSGMTSEEMDEILGKHFGNIKTQNTIFDKNGFQTYVRNGNSITRSNSNRSQAIGISV
jgi:hypothetical protein